MIVHLGRRVSALLDGQLSPSETERAWQHVHVCHPCRDLVEIEGRIKTQLAGLSRDRDGAPSYLKGSLLGNISTMAPSCASVSPASASRAQQRMMAALVGTSALGVAILGAFVLTAPLGQTSVGERRLPVSDLTATTAPQLRSSARPRSVWPGVGTARTDAERLGADVTDPISTPAGAQRVQRGHHLARQATYAVK
ncbi:MAG: hypothetical protein ACRCYU_20140 [Nocardioides sp.]